MGVNAEQSFRLVVRPLAGFLVLHGIAMVAAVSLSLVPLTWTPFLSQRAAPWAMSALAVFHVLIGIGLWARRRLAWLAFVVELTLAAPLFIAAALIDPPFGDDLPAAVMALGVVATLLPAALIYVATKPAFCQRSQTART